jgi:RNA polymerase sigma-70 factor (ECF subfamily)
MPAGDAVERLLRAERASVLATLVRLTGSIDAAEDVLHDAVERALQAWPRSGVPLNPRAWLLLTARRRAIDVLRREAQRGGKEAEAMHLLEHPGDDPPETDLLRLVFTCCHPTLAMDAQVALSLRTLGGLTTAEIARAMLVSEVTMAKRLTRAKQKIVRANIPYRVPAAAELPERLNSVAATIYLVFNEGYTAGAGADLVRAGLAGTAIGLARMLVDLMPDEPTALGLLALLLLQHARRDARCDAAGEVVLLADQDRARWDGDAIREGVTLVGAALRRTPERPDGYAVQAAIAACHALAPSYVDTDWPAVVSWYDVLLTVQDTPVVRLNRAAAIAERDGPAAALEIVEALPGLDSYVWWQASRAELLRRLGRLDAARAAYAAALALPMNEPLRRHLRGRADDARRGGSATLALPRRKSPA